MTSNLPTDVVRNSARGDQSYRAARHRIFQSITQNPTQVLGGLSEYITTKLLTVRVKTWFVLGFDRKDWDALEFLTRKPDQNIDASYARLLGDYIITNADRVGRLYEASALLSAAIVVDRREPVDDVIKDLDRVDKQSLLIFRTFGAINAASSEGAMRYFKNEMATDWLKKRFFYPFVYFFASNPPDSFLDTFLSYVIGSDVIQSERATIKFLLRDEIAYDLTPAFKFYIALLCHPYDACEFLLNHIEIVFLQAGRLPQSLSEVIEDLAKKLPIARIIALRDAVIGREFEMACRPTSVSPSYLPIFAGQVPEVLLRFADISIDTEFDDQDQPPPIAGLVRMRRNQ